jgi:hypothetical protein
MASNALLFSEVANYYNSTSANVEDKVRYEILNNNYSVGEAVARKRKLAILKVCSIKHCSDPAKSHFVAVDGMKLDIEGNSAIGIVDPAAENRDNLNLPPFFGIFREVRLFDKVGAPPVGIRRLYLNTDSPDLVPTSVAINGRVMNVRSKKGAVSSRFDGGTVSLETIDSPDSGDARTMGGYLLTIPNPEEGTYTVNFQATSKVTGLIEAKVFNSGDQVNQNASKTVSLEVGETTSLSIAVTDTFVSVGSMEIASHVTRFDRVAQKSMTTIIGHLTLNEFSNGIFPSVETWHVIGGTTAAQIPASAVVHVPGGYHYLNPKALNGVREFLYSDGGDFTLDIASLDIPSSVAAKGVPIQIRIGDDEFNGNALQQSTAAVPLLYFSRSGLTFNSGERVEGKIYSTVDESSAELEQYIKLQIDGLPNLADRRSPGLWQFRTLKLSSGAHSLRATAYLQNKRLANEVGEATGALKKRIYEIDDRLEVETDPETIESLSHERASVFSKINDLELILDNSRKQIGAPLDETIDIN